MELPIYNLSANADLTVFEFVSIGPNGLIHKAIKYSETQNPQVYNLGFGDIISANEDTGEVEIDDEIVSNNGDIKMVLATVARSVYLFTENHPDVLVLFGCSNPAKVRLYRMAISKYYDLISETFIVYGAERKNGQVINVPFTANATVDGYFVKRR